MSLDTDSRQDIVKKTEGLLQSIMTAIDSTTYFQTISANNILLELVHFDGGQEILTDIILEKEFPILIHNLLTEQNENINLLTVLIQNNRLDLFQILFNQAILDYHNGSSVNLFPLMNAVFYLENKRMPGKIERLVI
jgi:hypothetical protein